MELEKVAGGLKFPEGPIALADGSVLVVEIMRGTLTRIAPDGRAEVVAHLGGGPNGAAIGPDGAAYICNNGGFNWREPEPGIFVPHGTPTDYETGSIQRVDLESGEVTTLYQACESRPLRGPNDLVFDASGGFWFTDMGKSDGDTMHVGHLLYAQPDGSSIVRVRENLLTPNGIGLSPDGSQLHVAETMTSRLWTFDVNSPGRLAAAAGKWTAGRVRGPLSGYRMFDSLAVEADGRVCVATLLDGAITVFDDEGAWDEVAVPDPFATNICFGGRDLRTAWITASATGVLYRCRWPRPGLRLAFNR